MENEYKTSSSNSLIAYPFGADLMIRFRSRTLLCCRGTLYGTAEEALYPAMLVVAILPTPVVAADVVATVAADVESK